MHNNDPEELDEWRDALLSVLRYMVPAMGFLMMAVAHPFTTIHEASTAVCTNT